MSQNVQRFDRVSVGGERTRLPSGAIRLTGELTRSGVFEYTRADGTKVKEYRPPEEVSKADSLATLEDLPLTIGHPRIGMSAATYGQLTVGHIRSPQVVKLDSGAVKVRGTIIAGRKDAADAIMAGKLAETSMGYRCDVEDAPGVTPEGERYDAVQRNIVYNHGAALPPGEARLGTRLDSSAGEATEVFRLDSKGDQIAPDTSEDTMDQKETISKLEAERDAATARADSLEAELKTHREDAAKRERAALEFVAAGVLGKGEKFDGKTDRQVREAVIAKRLPAVKCDGKDDVYVATMFEAALTVKADSAPAKRGSQALVNALASRGDADDKGKEPDGDEDEEWAKKAKDMKKKADSAWERN